MNLFSFLSRPQPWSWLIQDDPNPQLSRLDLMDLRVGEPVTAYRCTHLVAFPEGDYRCEFPATHDGAHFTRHGATEEGSDRG